MTVEKFPDLMDHVDAMKGATLPGCTVVIDGREIPLLMMEDKGETVWLTLDRRFGISVPRDQVLPVAWLVAQALAIGQGYPSLNAEEKGRPFAPQVATIDLG